MRPCLVKLHFYLLCEFQIEPKNRILMRFPIIFCMEQPSALSSRMESPPHNYHRPSGLL